MLTEEKNRLGRRIEAAKARSKKPKPFLLSTDYAKRKDQRSLHVANNIKKIQKKKVERLAKEMATDKPINKKIKITPAQLKQIKRKAKRIKFANKIKNLL